MSIDLTRLINNLTEEIFIDEFVTIDKSYIEKTEIIDLKDVYVHGSIKKNIDDIYLLGLDVSGTMVLHCSLSLEETDYDFNFNLVKILSFEEDSEENIKILNNSIDIIPIIWHYIVMEIPIKIVNKKIDEKEYKAKYNIIEE